MPDREVSVEEMVCRVLGWTDALRKDFRSAYGFDPVKSDA